MPELGGSKTEANLRAAFTKEAEASRRFLYFAQQADVEGHPAAAALFRAASDGETGHALGHLDFLTESADPVTGMPIASTEENLASAAVGEDAEAKNFYPAAAATARQEGFVEIADWLESLVDAEGQHAERFRAAAETLDQ